MRGRMSELARRQSGGVRGRRREKDERRTSNPPKLTGGNIKWLLVAGYEFRSEPLNREP